MEERHHVEAEIVGCQSQRVDCQVAYDVFVRERHNLRLVGRATRVHDKVDILSHGLLAQAWVGGTFPLMKHISDGADFSKDRWVLLLYHHDCPMCQEALPHYQRLAKIVGQKVA